MRASTWSLTCSGDWGRQTITVGKASLQNILNPFKNFKKAPSFHKAYELCDMDRARTVCVRMKVTYELSDDKGVGNPKVEEQGR